VILVSQLSNITFRSNLSPLKNDTNVDFDLVNVSVWGVKMPIFVSLGPKSLFVQVKDQNAI